MMRATFGRAGDTQFEQSFLDLFLGEAMCVHDRKDRIRNFCVADYLVELK